MPVFAFLGSGASLLSSQSGQSAASASRSYGLSWRCQKSHLPSAALVSQPWIRNPCGLLLHPPRWKKRSPPTTSSVRCIHVAADLRPRSVDLSTLGLTERAEREREREGEGEGEGERRKEKGERRKEKGGRRKEERGREKRTGEEEEEEEEEEIDDTLTIVPLETNEDRHKTLSQVTEGTGEVSVTTMCPERIQKS